MAVVIETYLNVATGQLFGNSLSRVPLASLPGAAVTSINIEGVCMSLTQFQVFVKT